MGVRENTFIAKMGSTTERVKTDDFLAYLKKQLELVRNSTYSPSLIKLSLIVMTNDMNNSIVDKPDFI